MSNKVLEKDKYIFLERPAMEIYNKNEILLRQEEITIFLNELKLFKVKLLDLTQEVPEKSTRNLLLNAAIILNDDKKLLEKFLVRRKIPRTILSKVIEEPIYELQKWNGYLVAYTLLLQEGKYNLLKKYLQYSLKENADSFPKENLFFSGIGIKSLKNRTILLTSQGEFILIKDTTGRIAEVMTGTRTLIKKGWQKPLLFILLAAVLLGVFAHNFSQNVQNTIIIKAVGEVKMEYNSFGNMVSIKGINGTGKKFVDKAVFINNDIDTTVAEIIEQAYIQEVIKEKDEITLLISGPPLQNDSFRQGRTHDRILSYQLNCKINNNGTTLPIE